MDMLRQAQILIMHDIHIRKYDPDHDLRFTKGQVVQGTVITVNGRVTNFFPEGANTPIGAPAWTGIKAYGAHDMPLPTGSQTGTVTGRTKSVRVVRWRELSPLELLALAAED